MTWLYVPSACVPEWAGSTWDSSALERLARSVTSNGKHSLPRVWSQRCKKGAWLKLLSGVTCEPSTLERGVAAWISSLADTPASRSARPDDGSEPQTLGTSGPKSCGSTASQEPDTCSARTSPDTFRLGSPTSLPTLPKSGRMLNGACSARPTLERRTDASGCSSWPTPTSLSAANSNAPGNCKAHNETMRLAANLWPTPDTPGGGRTMPEGSTLTGSTPSGRKVQVGLENAAKMWPTPDAAASNDGEQPETWTARRDAAKAKGNNGNGIGIPLAMAAKLWPTATVMDSASACNSTANRAEPGKAHAGDTLTDAVRMWSTPTAQAKMWPSPVASEARQGFQDRTRGKKGSQESLTTIAVNSASLLAQTTAKAGPSGSQRAVLNPAFVEALMGFPCGWVNCELWATPSSPKSRRSRSANSGPACTETSD